MRPSVRAGWLTRQAGKRRVEAARGRRRMTAVGGAVALCLAVAGCGVAGSSSVTATGNDAGHLRERSRRTSPNSASAQDVLDAEQLAFSQQGGQIGTFKLRMVKARRPASSPTTRAPRSRTPARSPTSARFRPGASADSLGITNAQDLLQVTPTDTALELTQATAAVPGSPDHYYESLKTYGRTFARVVPTTALEAKAQVQEMQSLGVEEPVRDRVTAAPTGRRSRWRSRTTPRQPGSRWRRPRVGADAMFYGASSDAAAEHAFNAAVSSSPSLKLFAPSAVDDPTFASGLSPAARSVYVSSPGFLPSDLPAEGKQFVTDFTATYHRAPSLEAIFGYEAMQAVLYALTKAGSSANNRGDRGPATSSRSRTAARCWAPTRSTPTGTRTSARSSSAACGRASSSRSSPCKSQG